MLLVLTHAYHLKTDKDRLDYNLRKSTEILNTVGIISLGSSYGTAINTNSFNTPAMSFLSAAQTSYESEYIYKNIASEIHPESVIFIPVSLDYLYRVKRDYSAMITNNMPFRHKSLSWGSYLLYWDAHLSDIAVVFGYLRYYLNDKFLYSFLETNPIYRKNVFSPEVIESKAIKYLKTLDISETTENSNKQALYQLTDKAAESGACVILYQAPKWRLFTEKLESKAPNLHNWRRPYDALQDRFNNHGCVFFIDNIWTKELSGQVDLFTNLDHLNTLGSELFTEKIMEHLCNIEHATLQKNLSREC